MKTKRLPLGTCDHCKKEFPSGISLYTSKGKPRLYCSRDCRNTANSRAGAPVRARKARERVRRGEWQNPIHLEDPEARREHARVAGRKGRRAEVEAGTWRNPALEPEAREKLSRPRRHADNPTLHSAIEKLKQGASVADLTPEEQEAHRAYRRQLDRQRRAALTPEQRQAQRARWRTYYHRRKKRKKE